MVGGDWRINEAKLLRDRHEAVLTEARTAVGKIAVALRDLESKGRKVTGTHTTVDDDNAGGVHRADRRP